MHKCKCVLTLSHLSEGIPADITSGGDDVATRKCKSTCGEGSGSFCCSVSALCVHILFTVVCPIYIKIYYGNWQARDGLWRRPLRPPEPSPFDGIRRGTRLLGGGGVQFYSVSAMTHLNVSDWSLHSQAQQNRVIGYNAALYKRDCLWLSSSQRTQIWI